MANPYKKIERLERQNANLRAENEKLRWGIKDALAVQDKAEAMIKAANEKQLEFDKLIVELEKARGEYRELMRVIRSKLSRADKKYKEAFKEAMKDIK